MNDYGKRPAPRYLLPSQVAVLFHVSPKTVHRWANEGRLPFIRTLGNHRRYPEAEIRKLIDDSVFPVETE